ncbi:MAG: low molecular weight protein-tyrosine-phosphatase [Flavobacteriaceae bacterium]|nr:low molecular weight protein-tyrosine-phosphatase [Flavobacteriaceae bacterium]
MVKILMVCLGNICRSPLAHGILESKLPKDRFKVDSAGTAGYHIGEQPDPRSIAIARDYDLDITNQRGRQFKVEDFDEFDHIYVMDRSNYHNVMALARNERDRDKVRLILDEVSDVNNNEVPDPYYGGNDGFKNVYLMLEEACETIARKLTSATE